MWETRRKGALWDQGQSGRIKNGKQTVENLLCFKTGDLESNKKSPDH